MGFLDKIQDTITSATEQTKSKAQDMQLKKERKQKIEAVGEQVYNLYLNGQLSQQELAGACQEVADLDNRIQEAIAQAQAARPQPAPPPAAGAPGAPQAPTQPAPPAGSTPPPPAAPPSAGSGGPPPPPSPPPAGSGGPPPPPPPPPA